MGSENFAADGIVQQSHPRDQGAVPELLVITDICLCEYTDHGHCGVLNDDDHGLPEATAQRCDAGDPGPGGCVPRQAGADIVAPSGMMDGMVAAIRGALDGAGFEHVAIMSLRGEVRLRLSTVPSARPPRARRSSATGTSYQMDPANAREALREAALDVAEGADMLMVKPALAYLDIIRAVRERSRPPAGGLQRQRRVCHGEGGREQRLAGRAADGAGDA